MSEKRIGVAGPFDMTGHIAWVTGSASGIGKETARLMAQMGADVALHGLNQSAETEKLQHEIHALGRRAIALDGDLTQAAVVASLVQRIKDELGGLSVLVNCAGGSPIKSPIADMAEEDWDHVLDKNLKSVFLTTRAALPLLRQASRACIVNVSSCVTRTGGVPGGTAYATAKGGIEVFTRSMARELASEGIRVNAVSPGLVDSPFHSTDAKEKYPHLITRIPLGRIGAPQDLAGPILFLASDAAAYVTGETVEVSGGTRLVS
jgi:3-oxoacyl-[acyl-carrier protein] reductase